MNTNILITKRRRAFTITEIIIAVFIATIVAAGLMSLFISMSRVNRTSQAASLMRQESRQVMGKIEQTIRNAGRGDGVILMDATGADDFSGRRIRVRRTDPDTSQVTISEIRFVEGERLLLQHNIADENSIEVLSEPPAGGKVSIRPHVRDCEFFILVDANEGNKPIASGVRVELTLTDRGEVTRSWRGADDEREFFMARYVTLRAP